MLPFSLPLPGADAVPLAVVFQMPRLSQTSRRRPWCLDPQRFESSQSTDPALLQGDREFS